MFPVTHPSLIIQNNKPVLAIFSYTSYVPDICTTSAPLIFCGKILQQSQIPTHVVQCSNHLGAMCSTA